MFQISHIVNHVFNSRTYIFSKEGCDKVWLVDCGDVDELPPEAIVEGVLLTHTHSDHIYGLNILIERFPEVRIITNEFGVKVLRDLRLNISHYHADYGDFCAE